MLTFPYAGYTAFDVVAVGASHGGIPALGQLLSGLPRDFPAAVLVVQHLSAEFPSRLPDVLNRHSALPVQWAGPGQRIQPGQVYLAPPGQHIGLAQGGVLTLAQTAKVAFNRPSVTYLFESVAAVYGARGLAVVLTGAGSDGAGGVRAIKAGGGRVLVQQPATALAAGMPDAALRTGCLDFVLPLPYLAAALVTLVMACGGAALFRVPAAPRRGLGVGVRG